MKDWKFWLWYIPVCLMIAYIMWRFSMLGMDG